MEPSSNTPVKLAFTIGSYRLCDFVHLSLKQLRRLAPESHILVSDDAAPESGHIENLATVYGAVYRGSAKRRGHFANDLQAFVHALAFAEAAGADVAVKISQRFILRKPEVIDALLQAFADPNILVVTPGQPKLVTMGNGKPHGFGAFTCLSDAVAIRVGCISPKELLVMYRERLLRESHVAHGSFLECLADDFHNRRFPGKTLKLEAITNHPNREDPWFLRRYQNTAQQYAALANTHGIGGNFILSEWGQIEGRAYLCKPLIV